MTANLREQQRRATLAAIEESATSLVEERGYAAVTVEDICQAAQISRRTFFNYVDSKETAVLGAPPRNLSDEVIAEFVSARHADLLQATLRLCFLALPESDVPAEAMSDLAVRRKAIKRENPELVFSRMRIFDTSHRQIHDAVCANLERHPDSRQLDTTSELEAQAVVGIVAQCLQLGYRRWVTGGKSNNTVEILSQQALTHITQLLHPKVVNS